jgi:peroxiredoxin/predicted 2-oxoglutarate/Fe(II)-dependent dioxygenase YbiX
MRGEPAPWFTASMTANSNFHFDTVGGHRIVLAFFGSSRHPQGAEILYRFTTLQEQLEEAQVPFFGITVDPEDAFLENIIRCPAYFKLVWDFEYKISALYGVCQSYNGNRAKVMDYTPMTFVLNQNFQVIGVFPMQDPEQHVRNVLNCLQTIPEYPPAQMAARQAPALLIPNVLNPEFCQYLIKLHEADGGEPSGFMREVNGKTTLVLDDKFKKRRDFVLTDTKLLEHVNNQVIRRIKPEIEKAFQFKITRFERYLIACYEAQDQGFFRRHRDNTTKGTAHRRFAMTLNLNTGEYEGGHLWFPEYGSQLYRPQVGEAIIFSCSLLHEVTPITQGRRFALLSFFYNDQDAALRQKNLQHVNSSAKVKEKAKDPPPQPQPVQQEESTR